MYIYVSEAMLDTAINKVLTSEQKDDLTIGQLKRVTEKVSKFVEQRDKWLTDLVAKAVEKALEPTVELPADQKVEETTSETQVKPKRGKKNQQVLAEILD